MSGESLCTSLDIPRDSTEKMFSTGESEPWRTGGQLGWRNHKASEEGRAAAISVAVPRGTELGTRCRWGRGGAARSGGPGDRDCLCLDPSDFPLAFLFCCFIFFLNF